MLTGVTNSGEPYTLDKETQKISIYNKTYSYRTDQEIFYLTYPDGAVFSVSPSGAVWYGSSNQHYALPGDLISILEKHHVEISAAGQAVQKPHPLLGMLLIIIGILDALCPKISWQLTIGWKIKNGEPADFYLTVVRVIGVLLALIGIILLFSSC